MRPSDRLSQWQQRRSRRLQELGLIAAPAARGGPPAYFVADEVLVLNDHRNLALDTLATMGHRRRDTAEDSSIVGGFRRYRARNLDVVNAARTIRGRIADEGDPRPAATPNHVFMSAPFEHGGPCGPPLPTEASLELPTRRRGARVPVAVIDTGVWRDSPLPPGYYEATEADFESNVDVDQDGFLDGDVGHANFIAGVIAQGTPRAAVQIVRVLDTFGVCTELELIEALERIADDTVLVNLSLGGYTVDDQPPAALGQALQEVLGVGDRLVVAAAGNDGLDVRPFWPAAFAATDEVWHGRVVAVAAHDGKDVCDWSNRGEWITLAAPGSDVTSTYVHHAGFTNGWAQWSGTSFATPHVVAALVQHIKTGTSTAKALTKVLAAAAEQTYGDHPGLP